MTDSKERLDPRYDPRYQRGYVGGEADVPFPAIPHPESTPQPEFVPPPQVPPAAHAVVVLRDADSPRPLPEGRARAVPAPSPAAEADGPAATSAPATIADDADRSGADRASDERTDADETDADRAGAAAAARARSAAVAPADGGIASWPANVWLWIAFGACLAFVVVGSWAIWSQVSDPRNYLGSVSVGVDESLRLLVSYLAPALVQAGVVGAVVVLATWAIRGRSSRRAGHGDDR